MTGLPSASSPAPLQMVPAPPAGRRGPAFLTRERVLLALVLAAAAALRFAGLGRQSLWLDEVFSVIAARRILELGWADQLFNGHGPLFFYLLAAVLPAQPDEVSVRLLSAFFGVGLVGMAYLLGRELVGPRAGILAAAVTALAPFAVWYSQEARYESVFMLLAAISLLSAHRLLERGALRDLAIYAIATPLMLFAFVGGIFLVLALNLWAALERPRGRRLARWAAAQVFVALLFLPWFVEAYGVIPDPEEAESGTFSVSQLRAGYFRETEPVHLGYVPYTFGVGYAWGPSTQELHEALNVRTVLRHAAQVVPAVLIVGALVVAGFLYVWRRSRRHAALLLLCTLLPPLGSFALSSVSNLAFNVRYTSAAFPAFALLMTAGLLWWKERGRWGAAVCAAAVGLWVLALASYYVEPAYAREDSRGVARLLHRVKAPGEPLVVGASVKAFQFYYKTPFLRGDQVRLVNRPEPGQEPLSRAPRTWVAVMRPWQKPDFVEVVRRMRACYRVERTYRVTGYELIAFRTGEAPSGEVCTLVADRSMPTRITPARPL